MPRTDAETKALQDEITKLSKSNEIMRKETHLWESFIHRNAPHLLHESADSRQASTRNNRRLKMVTSLTPDQKFFVATRELEAIRDEIEKRQKEGEKEIERLHSLREETDTRISEYKKDAFEFRRDIVTGAVNPRTGNIAADRLAQYFDQKIKNKQHQIEKLKLKNLSMKTGCTKLEAQLLHKEEMGEVFLPIDFDQLKIENQQYLEKIEERNNELLKLKVIAGNTVGLLNNYKKKLNKFSGEHEYLQKEIKQREDIMSKIKRETDMVTKEIDKASTVHKKLKQQNEEYRVPEVLDYVQLKAELYELEKKVQDWERKVAIAEMKLKRDRTLARTQNNETAGGINNGGTLQGPSSPSARLMKLLTQQKSQLRDLHVLSSPVSSSSPSSPTHFM